MPVWTKNIAEVLSLTHFLRIVRGTLLKGNSLTQLTQALWLMLAFFCRRFYCGQALSPDFGLKMVGWC
jgi:hypothetical protein